MSENNKILEVTYGHFSCRLEGFDDAVETMKIVVSYFHGLAGNKLFTDKDFVVPDIETLIRLAAEQSDAKIAIEAEENRISLRVMLEEEVAQVRALSDDVDEPMPEKSVDTAVEIEEQSVDYTVKTGEDDVSEDVTEHEEELQDIPESAASEAFDDEADDEASALDQVEENVFAESVKPNDHETSVAEKLQRIRAAVGRGGQAVRDDTYVEDLTENEPLITPKAVNPLAQRLAELAKRNSELIDTDALRQTAPAEESTPLSPTEEKAIEDLPEEAIEDNVDSAPLVLHTQEQDDIADDVPAVEVTSKADMADDDDDDNDDVRVEESAAPAEKVASKQSERDDQPLLLTTRHRPITDYIADDSDDDNFDLQEEVAKIEREIASRPGNDLARHGLPRSVEDAMSRIMTKTDLQLDLQETRDGRDAIAQLKAAVAATEAARQLGDLGAKSRDASALFRDDLGALEGTENSDGTALPPLKLVEPIRSEKPAGGPSRSLRDVAPMTEAAARLRGIAASSKAKSTEAKVVTFADFAQQHGATDLVDKLEAAAAYIAFVEGESDFSRPQVMKVVQSATEAEVTREDGLRCFGRLLRQSRIVKLNNGRFQIPNNTRFRPSGNQAAQG
jgi:hypothetical protein